MTKRISVRQPKADKPYTIELTGMQLTVIRYALSLARTQAENSAKLKALSPSDRLLNSKAADQISEIENSIVLQMEFNN